MSWNRSPHGFVWVLLLGFLMACQDGHSENNSAEKASGKPPVAVETVRVKAQDLADTIGVVGSLTPKFSAEIKSQITAVVAEVLVTEWVPVKKGTLLARLDMREEQAGLDGLKAAVLQAEVAQNRSNRELERALKLKASGLITQQGLDDAHTALDAAQAQTQAAKAQLKSAQARLTRALITAPFDGVIAFRGVSVGDRVENMGSTMPMFRIVDNRILDLTVSIPSLKMAQIKVGQPLDFTVDAFPDQTFTGEVMFINPCLNAADRTVQVIAEVQNPSGMLRGGLFAKGLIRTAVRHSVMQIPRSALFNLNLTQGTAEVFVLKETKAELRPVQIGSSSGEYVEISSGLVEGEEVVTRGAFNLRNGDNVTVITQGK